MDKFELATYMDWLLRRALCRCGRLYEAEELVSDTIVSALDALDEGVTITNPRAWLARILERRFCDMQRKRYREAASQLIYDSEPPDDLNLEQIFEDAETAESIRRGIAMLTGIYREVVVQYYLNERSISEIAELYKLPEGTIKSRLNTGRRQLKEELEVEKYQRESYFPDYLYVTCSGRSGNDGEPWSLIANDRATMNLLIVAYAKPLTISEIADAIGVSAAYIEPVVKRLVDGQLMRCVANRYYTDFAIATEADRTANLPAILKLAEKITPELWGYIDEGLSMLRSRDYYKRQEKYAAQKLESSYITKSIQSAVLNIRDAAYGGMQPFSEYPERPNDGKWYAMGNLYPYGYDFSRSPTSRYNISGEASSSCENVFGLKTLRNYDFDTDETIFGATYKNYGNFAVRNKLLYAAMLGREELYNLIDDNYSAVIDNYVELKFLIRNGSGGLILTIPVISPSERSDFLNLCGEMKSKLIERFSKDITPLASNPLKLPKHIESVPEWIKHMWCVDSLPMAIVAAALDSGLYVPDRTGGAQAMMFVEDKG
ncbi:MAG TPA: RNA polymerase sigma factor [Firmicutes bacterium]|nr:RNA polymerase sigma factor [Bacillota bacterium]